MFQWRVILLAALAVSLLLAGLVALIMPDAAEGPALYYFDAQHSLHVLDLLGAALLALGCILAWGAGAMWQRRMYAS